MKSILALVSLFFLVYSNLAQAQKLEPQVRHLLDSVYKKNKDALGILIHVASPDQNVSLTASIGFADKSKTIVLKPFQPVLIASNTKPYVSASILRLVEDKRITLDTPIENLLTKKTRKLLEQHYNIKKITCRHLLSHTSGIRDYVDSTYFNFVIEHPNYQWTRDEQIKRAMKQGPSIASPGSTFQYGDINYILLTEIIEVLTRKPFYMAMRDLLKFDALRLSNTWFKDLEPTPTGSLPFAHQYAKDFKWDSYHINPSWDLYGGGGLAATVKDAALFYQYLFEGKIIKNKEILNEMYTYIMTPDRSKYCLGVYHFDFGFHLYYHGGWWGTDVNYSPETNTSIAVFTLVKEKRGAINPFLGKKIHELIK